MHGLMRYIGFLLVGFMLLACKSTPTDSVDALPAPKLLPSPPDTALVEKGIDAVEIGDYIQLDWEPGDDQTVFQYAIYRRKQDEQDFSLRIRLDGRVTSFLDSAGIEIGKRAYYYVTALNDDGVESAPSDTLSYLLVEKAYFLLLLSRRVPPLAGSKCEPRNLRAQACGSRHR